jgi:hypothetical protein
MASIQSAGSESERRWRWCVCTRASYTGVKCPECVKPLGIYDVIVEYGGSHWHLSCLLDNRTKGPQLADNPLSPLYGGAGFHP